MATPQQWWQGARPRTLPAAVAPVLVGSGAAAAEDGFAADRAALAMGVALALQVGVNYANDYSDGVRGTDTDRVGPMRLVGSGVATPPQVRRAALASFALAAVLGLVLVALTGQWWLLGVGAVAVVAAWGYTGGPSPYGYRGLGELSVFVFFGLVATVGTTYVQLLEVTTPAVLGGVAVGSLATAILVVNNLRDIPTDASSGKRTLAVRLGDRWTRRLFLLLLALAYATTAAIAVYGYPRALLGWLSLPWAMQAVTPVERGATGPALIPALVNTGRAELWLAIGLTLGLVLG
ncbi:MAG: 1,4-dihydroxy-2-naphthoate polyprenyltransferase [Jiangellales bacterium]